MGILDIIYLSVNIRLTDFLYFIGSQTEFGRADESVNLTRKAGSDGGSGNRLWRPSIVHAPDPMPGNLKTGIAEQPLFHAMPYYSGTRLL